MNRHIPLLFCILCASLTCVFIAPEGAAKAGNFFMSYYTSPAPEQVAAAFAELDSVQQPMSDDDDWPLAMFMAEVFVANPEVAAQLVKQRAGHSPRGRYTIALAVCQADLKNKKLCWVNYCPASNGPICATKCWKAPFSRWRK